MAFHVEIQPQAFDDLDSISDRIKAASSFATAEKWFNGILDDIASLKEMPERCMVAPESKELNRNALSTLAPEVRVLLHGRKNRAYKIYFSIQCESSSTGMVSVFHVRHWARKPLTREELEELMNDRQERGIEEES